MSTLRRWPLAILMGGLAFLSLAVIAMLAQGQEARAATLTVTTVDDELNSDGDCSLREAIHAANTDSAVDACTGGSGPDTIVVPAGTYTLNITPDGTPDDNWDGDLDILGDLIIDGAGAGLTFIDGGGVDRVFDINGEFSGGATVEINGVTVLNGRTVGSDPGGGILVISATLTLNDSVVTANSASGEFNRGGGIFAGFATLTVVDTLVHANSAGSGGGGIAAFPAQLTLNGSSVNSNTSGGDGGGILSAYTSSDAIAISDSTVAGNIAGQAGGGIYNSGHSMTVTRTIISGNAANGTTWPDMGGGGVYNASSSTTQIVASQVINNTTYGGGSGGGILNLGDMTVRDSSVSGNRYAPGGGIYNGGTLTIEGTTISSNNLGGGFEGGGLHSSGSLDVTNATIVGNTGVIGGGIYVSAGTALLTNVTVAGNTTQFAGYGAITAVGTTLLNSIVASNNNGNCGWTILSGGHNISSDATCGLGGAGDLNNTDPLLGPLQENGGPTQTHALLPGSPAIDAGSTDCPPPAIDQRGVARPQGAFCDIGAYEYDGPTADKLGDVSCDDVVNVVDALFVLQYEVGQREDSGGCPLPPPPPDALNVANCDVSGDGLCNVVDALFILQCEVGISNPFCPAAVQVTQEELGPRPADRS